MSFRRPSVVPLVSLGVLRKAQLSVSRLWSVYNEQLVVRPVLTRSLTSMVGLVSGDALAQFSAGGKYDSARALRTAAYAFLISGPVNYKFYKFLDQVRWLGVFGKREVVGEREFLGNGVRCHDVMDASMMYDESCACDDVEWILCVKFVDE